MYFKVVLLIAALPYCLSKPQGLPDAGAAPAGVTPGAAGHGNVTTPSGVEAATPPAADLGNATTPSGIEGVTSPAGHSLNASTPGLEGASPNATTPSVLAEASTPSAANATLPSSSAAEGNATESGASPVATGATADFTPHPTTPASALGSESSPESAQKPNQVEGGSAPNGPFVFSCEPQTGGPQGTYVCKIASTSAQLSGKSESVAGGNESTTGAGNATAGVHVLCVTGPKNNTPADYIALSDAAGKPTTIAGTWKKRQCPFGPVNAYVVNREELIAVTKQCGDKGFEVPQPQDPDQKGAPFEYEKEGGGQELMGFYREVNGEWTAQPSISGDKCT